MSSKPCFLSHFKSLAVCVQSFQHLDDSQTLTLLLQSFFEKHRPCSCWKRLFPLWLIQIARQEHFLEGKIPTSKNHVQVQGAFLFA